MMAKSAIQLAAEAGIPNTGASKNSIMAAGPVSSLKAAISHRPKVARHTVYAALLRQVAVRVHDLPQKGFVRGTYVIQTPKRERGHVT